VRSGRESQKLQRRHLRNELYAILEEAIVSGKLPPGTRLSEEAVAAKYGVSRSPAREALHDLERAGFAERLGFRDRQVLTPTEAFIRNTYDVWKILQVGRTYLASLKSSPDKNRELSELHRQLGAALAAGNDSKYRTLSTKFHRLLDAPCENYHLDRILSDYRKYIRWLDGLYYAYFDDVSHHNWKEHAAILAAYVRRDLLGLTQAICTHISTKRDNVLHGWRDSKSPRRIRSAGSRNGSSLKKAS
jgi:DNA-binding GntR family transcriptional regulator